MHLQFSLPSSTGWSVRSVRRCQRPFSVACTPGKPHRSTCQHIPRRHWMLSLLAAPLLSTLSQPSSASADTAQKLPKGYEDFAGKLIGALQEAIEADLSDMEERQVRRKADPAKNLVKGWIQDWKERSDLEQEISHRELSGVIRQLGDFYRKQGVRSRLPRSVGEDLLAKLSAAQNSLPLPPSADGKQKA
ncbi:g12374 [Coccomyxa viridis]|uniref:G12374 protein n=1 Tax=Coccomyxa viridis TaxID=1274662 RepID=A0ABP1GA70_9CHLO